MKCDRVPDGIRKQFIQLVAETTGLDSMRAYAYAHEQILFYEAGVRDVRLSDVSIFLIDSCGF